MISLYLGLVALLLVALLLLLLPNQQAIKQYRGVLFVTVLVFLMGSAALYRVWGGSEGLQHQRALQAIEHFFVAFSQNQQPTKAQLLDDLITLENTVAYSHIALARLGEVYNQLGMPEKALVCYQQASHRAPLIKEYAVQQIYSYSLLQQGKLSATIREQAQRLLQQVAGQPEQFVLMNLLAIDDYFKGDYASAVNHWQYLIAQDKSLTDERRQVLIGAIQKAQWSLPSDDTSLISVTVQLNIEKSLLAQVQPDDVVFVYVKSSQQKMPLAVQKHLARELPFSVELTNKDEMLPGMGLKAGEKVQVFAKISRSGDPLSQDSTLQGKSEPLVVDYGTNAVNIAINHSSL